MNGFVPTQSAFVQGPDISGLMGGVGQRRAQEQQQKGMLSTLLGVDMSGMSEQGIKYSQSLRDHLVNSLTDGNEDFTYDDFVRGVIGLQDFIVRDKKTYAENLAIAQPILSASVNEATYDTWRGQLEQAGKYMSYEAVQQYAADFDRMLENPYPGNFFNPSDMMLFADDPALAMRNMMPAAGMNILGVELPQQNAFQYELEDLPTGDVFAYMKNGGEANLISFLAVVDNEADAKEKIAQHYSTYILGTGPGRKALQESLAAQDYFIKDLAENLVGFEGVDPSGMGEHLTMKGDPLGRGFEANNQLFYEKFEEYYMDVWESEKRKADRARRDARRNNRPGTQPKIVAAGAVSSSPTTSTYAQLNPLVTSSPGITDIVQNTPGLENDVLAQARATNQITTSIMENGFQMLTDRSAIVMPSAIGSSERDFSAEQFSVIGVGDYNSQYLVLGGTRSTPITKRVPVLPYPEPSSYTTEVDENGQTIYVYEEGTIKEDDLVTVPFNSVYATNYYEALGEKIVKASNVDIVELPPDFETMSDYYEKIGMSMVISRLANAKGAQVYTNLFPPTSVQQANQILTRAQIKGL